MQIYASEANLQIVQQAITDLVKGVRQVKVEYVTADGYKNSFEYASVNLGELRNLESSMINTLFPKPIMECIDVEIEF